MSYGPCQAVKTAVLNNGRSDRGKGIKRKYTYSIHVHFKNEFPSLGESTVRLFSYCHKVKGKIVQRGWGGLCGWGFCHKYTENLQALFNRAIITKMKDIEGKTDCKCRVVGKSVSAVYINNLFWNDSNRPFQQSFPTVECL